MCNSFNPKYESSSLHWTQRTIIKHASYFPKQYLNLTIQLELVRDTSQTLPISLQLITNLFQARFYLVLVDDNSIYALCYFCFPTSVRTIITVFHWIEIETIPILIEQASLWYPTTDNSVDWVLLAMQSI